MWQFKVKYATIFKAYCKKETAVSSLIHFQIWNQTISPHKFLLLITVYYSSDVIYRSR